MTYASTDGHSWDALLAHPPARSARSEVLVVAVHGAMGNYTSGVVRRATLEMARRGYPDPLDQHAHGQLRGHLRRRAPGPRAGRPRRRPRAGAASWDTRASRCWATASGPRWSPTTRRCAGRRRSRPSAPWPTRPRCPRRCATAGTPHGASPATPSMLERAGRRVAADDRGDDIVVVTRGSGDRDGPRDAEVWTERTWWACRAPQATHAISRERVRHMSVPAGADPARARTSSSATAPSWPPPPARPACRCTWSACAGTDHTLWDAVPAATAAGAAWLDRTLGTGGRPARPGAAPEHPRDGVQHRLITIRCDDGTHHDALLHIDPAATERRSATRGRVAVLHLHGNQGNFSVGALRFLGDPLAGAGHPDAVAGDPAVQRVADLRQRGVRGGARRPRRRGRLARRAGLRPDRGERLLARRRARHPLRGRPRAASAGGADDVRQRDRPAQLGPPPHGRQRGPALLRRSCRRVPRHPGRRPGSHRGRPPRLRAQRRAALGRRVHGRHLVALARAPRPTTR